MSAASSGRPAGDPLLPGQHANPGAGQAPPGAAAAPVGRAPAVSPNPRRESRSSRQIGVPSDVTWHRVSIISPFLEGWKVFTGILAFFTYQNIDELLSAYRFVRTHGVLHAEYILYFLLGLVLLLAAWAGLGVLSWWRRTYAVDADGVYLRTGVLHHHLRTARLPRIQSVDIVHPLLGRIFGLGQLTVEIAGGSDSRIVIGYLRSSQLEELRDRILSLAAGVEEHAPEGTMSTVSTGAVGAASPATAAGGGGPAGQPGAAVGQHPGSPARPAGAEEIEAASRAPRLPGASAPQEHPLYEVDTATLIGSILRSGALVGTTALVVALLLMTALALIMEGGSIGVSDLGRMVSILAAPVGAATLLWKRFNRGWGFKAAATPTGIRMRYGLTSDTSLTLPPGRVHVVGLRQGLLWRSKDWWRVSAGVAGREARQDDSEHHESTSDLLPVGTRPTALRALWLVAPDLGTADPDGLLDSALTGMDDDGVGPAGAPVGSPGRGFVRMSRRGRIFAPLAWRRLAITLTDTCVIIRGGRWARWVSVVPYERIQSLSVSQGPWSRRLGLADLSLHMVSTSPSTSFDHLRAQEARDLAEEISRRALRRRSREQLDRWLLRATALPEPALRPVASPFATGPDASRTSGGGVAGSSGGHSEHRGSSAPGAAGDPGEPGGPGRAAPAVRRSGP